MVQIVEMTQEEKVIMYNKVSKKQLIEMLIESNKHLDRITPTIKLTEPVSSKVVVEGIERGKQIDKEYEEFTHLPYKSK